MWSGVVVQRIEKTSDLEGSNHHNLWHFDMEVPQALWKVHCIQHYHNVWCSKHPIIVLCPWHYKLFTAQFVSFTFLCPAWLVSPLLSGGLTFWTRIWSSLLAQGCQLSFHICWNWVQSPCQVWCPWMSSGQSPQACGPHCLPSCGVWWQHALLKLACQPLLQCHTFNGVFSPKEDCFRMSFVPATGQPTCSCVWCLIVAFLQRMV